MYFAAGRVIQFVFRMDNKIKAITSYAQVTLLNVVGAVKARTRKGCRWNATANFSVIIIIIMAAQLIEGGDRGEIQGLRGSFPG